MQVAMTKRGVFLSNYLLSTTRGTHWGAFVWQIGSPVDDALPLYALRYQEITREPKTS